MYVKICTRLNIANVVRVVSIYLSSPTKQYYQAMKWTMRYQNGTQDVCVSFRSDDQTLERLVDASLARDVGYRMSTTGFVLSLGHIMI